MSAADLPNTIEVRDLVGKAEAFIIGQQQPDGGFTEGARYALGITELATIGLTSEPGMPATDPRIVKALSFINGFHQPDGGVYPPEEGLGTYYTSLALMAWMATGTGETAWITGAQNYLFGVQETKDGISQGGFGYSNRKGSEDLSNSGYALQALRASGVPASDPRMQAAVKFLERCQDLSSVNKLSWARDSGGAVSLLDSKITAAMQLLQTDGRMHAIATPMLLAANNAPAEFFSGVTRMITTNYDYETRYSENGVATDIARPVVTEREIGTNVRIKPSINDDGTVTLRFYLQLGTVNPGGASISVIKGTSLVQLPIDTVNNDRVTSIVVAGHGQSVVMGGLISESASFQRSRVPGLGDIPALGMLFRKQDDQIERNETVVLITPHIMATPADAAGVSAGTLRRNSTHPWVRHDQAPVTVWDEQDARLKAIEYPARPEPKPGRPAPAAGTAPAPSPPAPEPAAAPSPGPTP